MSPTQFFRKDSVRIVLIPAIIVFWYVAIPLLLVGMIIIMIEESDEDYQGKENPLGIPGTYSSGSKPFWWWFYHQWWNLKRWRIRCKHR
jgi:hypothetical protein